MFKRRSFPVRLRCEALEDRSVPAANFWAVASSGAGGTEVLLLDADSAERFRVQPFGADYTGPVAAAVGDVTADGVPDLVVAAGAGGGPVVVVYDGATGDEERRFMALAEDFRGGLSVAVADVNRDAHADMILGAQSGGGPVVRIFDGQTGNDLGAFFAYDAAFRGGVQVAAADVDGDELAEIVTGAGVGGSAHVRVFEADGTLVNEFFAYDPDLRMGVEVAAGDLDGNSVAEIVTGAGMGGGPHVSVFDGQTGTNMGSFFAADAERREGVHVGVRYLNGQLAGIIDAVVGDEMRGFDGQTFEPMSTPIITKPGMTMGSPAQMDNDVVLDWTNIMLQTVWRTTTQPPQAARVMAIVGTAMHDAVNSIEGGYEPYRSMIAAPEGASVEAAAAAAASRALSELYPDRADDYATKLATSLVALDVSEQARADGVAVGTAAAEAILAERADDGSDREVPYTPGSEPGDYQLTPPGFLDPVGPQWPEVTPFGMLRGDQFRPDGPPPLDSAEYAADLNAVKEIGGTTSTIRTEEQAEIGHFWADVPGDSVTPPGHWLQIAMRVSREEGLSLGENAQLMGLLGLALADASIASWDAKYFFDLWRPETAIRQADTDGNPATESDPSWVPLWESPNFPAYTSGHSTYSAAGAAVLTALFGDDRSFATSSDDMPGVVRSYDNFDAAAEEAGVSRIYGGIHFQFDNTDGLSSGRAVGEFIVDNYLRPLDSPQQRTDPAELAAFLESDALERAAFDGTGNNQANPEWGTPFTQLVRGTIDYADGISEPSGADRPNPRAISNAVVDQDGQNLPNSMGLSDMVWMWGQFLDHDLSLSDAMVPREPFNISVPAGDPDLDPNGTGQAIIPLGRAIHDTSTGTSVDNPRMQLNQITGFIDGSNVYGSDEERAHALRTFNDGRLKVSDGDLLPFNTEGIENLGGPNPGFFVAGDIRANENTNLLSMHTLWVREHNRIADAISAANPDWGDEEIFQNARRLVIAQQQVITYNEFLPALMGPNPLPAYTGYDPNVNAQVDALFSTASFRMGHTLLSSELARLDNDGNVIPEGNLLLRSAFFQPELVTEVGIEPYLMGGVLQPAQEFDAKIVDDVRNFLGDPPGESGLDLASLNIQRGREMGIPSYNQARIDMGLAPVTSFAEVSSDPAVQQALASIYESVDDIDPWIGGLAEDATNGGVVGELINAVFTDQFTRSRDGDRFWYQNVYTGPLLQAIEQTTLADVIEQNTTIEGLRENVFILS